MQITGVFEKWLMCMVCIALSINIATAQTDSLVKAKDYVAAKQYDKALSLYKKLYNESPANQDIYSDYLDALITAKKYKDAENLAEDQLLIRRESPVIFIDIGRVYLAASKEKKAEEQFNKAIEHINGDDVLTQMIGNAFSNINNDKYAILTYERARDLLRNPYLYSSPLARLYAKTGSTDKAINALLDGIPGNIGGTEDTKAGMLELLGSDNKKMQLAQKAIIKRINEQPENIFFADILVWLYTQKNDWEGALIQIEAIDERNKENGQRILGFARNAVKESQYEIAMKALNSVIEKGRTEPMYAVAMAQKLEVSMQQIEDDTVLRKEYIATLSKEYSDFFSIFPQYYPTETLLDAAKLEAQYNNAPQKGIELLQKAITTPTASRDFVGRAKLQLGDYEILIDKIWDASLIYSQVDKAFREDMLGEEARFHNAKLAYYRGDFEWAQGQLNVLKASTSELIANDALYLSVLITENITADSNLVPLRRFAYADLLLFQNKYKEAEALLDSISKAFPKHPLNDDILMLRATIAAKHREYNKALDYLKDIYTQYGKDVLGDDAVLKTADIYDNKLHQKDKAQHFYEQLILDYPGSTYVQIARKKLQELQAAAIPVNP